jgi:hypothetical protein
MSGTLGVITLASLIAALVLSSQSISFIRTRLSQNMNTYIEDQSAIDVTDKIQTKYECCGVHLWLDWARISLGVATGTGTGTGAGTSMSAIRSCDRASLFPLRLAITGRRRRHVDQHSSSFLSRSVRLGRQVISDPIVHNPSNIYNLPSNYGFNLPLSCCKSGGTSPSTSVGGCKHLSFIGSGLLHILFTLI